MVCNACGLWVSDIIPRPFSPSHPPPTTHLHYTSPPMLLSAKPNLDATLRSSASPYMHLSSGYADTHPSRATTVTTGQPTYGSTLRPAPRRLLVLREPPLPAVSGRGSSRTAPHRCSHRHPPSRPAQCRRARRPPSTRRTRDTRATHVAPARMTCLRRPHCWP
jgi:hypothetical protein